MEFIELDLSQAGEPQIIAAIAYNNRVYVDYISEITKLKAFINKATKKTNEYYVEMSKTQAEKATDEKKVDRDFENEVEYYLSQLRKLKLSNIGTDFEGVIPSRKHYQYERILRRLELESHRLIKEIKDLLKTEGISFEDVNEFNEDVDLELQKIALIKQALVPQKEEQQQMEQKNKLIFVPTLGGDIRVLDEIDSIPPSYYERFAKLFNSIKDGTFKNVKRLTGNSVLDGLCEVRGDAVRVVFMRLNKDTYAIISAFIKKSDLDSAYRTTLAKKYSDFLEIQDKLKEKIKNEDFLALNQSYEEELFGKLAPTNKEPILQKKKVGEV